MFETLKHIPARITCIIILLILGILAYSQTLEVPFYLDDVDNIANNPAIQVNRLTLANITDAALNGPCQRRPLANVSFGLNYFFNGLDLPGYHIVNIFIHLLCGVLLFLVFTETLARLGPKETSSTLFIAFCAAAIWLVHPVQTQSVTYIVQRMNTMAAMFYLLTLYLFIVGRKSQKTGYMIGAGVAGICSLLSKEIAITLPIMLGIYEICFFSKKSLSGSLKKIFPYAAAYLVFCLAAVVFVFGTDPLPAMLAGYANRPFTLTERLLTESRVIFFYLSLLIFPHPSRLSLEHDFLLSPSLFSPISTFPAMVAITALIVAALLSMRKYPLVAFSVLWFFVCLAVESTFLPLEILFEHRLYLPSMFPVLFLVYATFAAISNRTVLLASNVLLIAVLLVWTVQRNQTWRLPAVFWRQAIEHAPNNPRPYSHSGLIFQKNGDMDSAMKAFRKAITLNPDFYQAHNNIAIIYKDTGRFDEAIRHFTRALSGSPNNADIHNNLGNIYARKGLLIAAEHHLQKSIELNGNNPVAYNNLGNLKIMQHEYQAAIKLYQKSLSLNPEYVEASYNLAIARKLSDQSSAKE